MSDLAERVRALGEQVRAGYDAGQTEAALAGLRAKLHRRGTRHIAVGSAIATLALVGGGFWALRWQHVGELGSAVTPKPLFTLSDGSLVTPLDPSSRVLAKTVLPKLVELELVAGRARFDVAPNREREFRVSAGRVGVIVVGTRFSVERQDERATVAVEAGQVRVEWERGQQLLHPGERGTFPPFEPVGPRGREAEPAAAPPPPATVGPHVAPARPVVDWRTLAARGDFPAAYRALHGKARPPADVDDLLLAADVARRSGKPAEAVPYLERALAGHESDARFAVAAFTLGRVRMSDLDDPAGAALAFAQARAAAPGGPLAEDALAREVEARSRSGDKVGARRLADDYLKTWPSGSHLRAVRHFGGLP